MPLTMKRGDTWPPLTATLTDDNGPIDLTTATTVKLLFKTSSGSLSYSRTFTVTSAVDGEVSYTWVAGDASSGPTSAVNTFQVEAEITWSDGSVTTVPNEGYETFTVTPDLG